MNFPKALKYFKANEQFFLFDCLNAVEPHECLADLARHYKYEIQDRLEEAFSEWASEFTTYRQDRDNIPSYASICDLNEIVATRSYYHNPSLMDGIFFRDNSTGEVESLRTWRSKRVSVTFLLSLQQVWYDPYNGSWET